MSRRWLLTTGFSMLLAISAQGADQPVNRNKPAEKVAPPAQEKARPDAPQRKFERLRMGPDGKPLPVDKSASTGAKTALSDAKSELSKAISATSGQSTIILENDLWKDAEYRKAVYQLRRAQGDYDAVRKPIFDALRTDSYYRDLERRKIESERTINSLILTGRGSFDWVFPAAVEAMEMRKRMTREQIIAMAQAPEVEDARSRMLLAAAKVRELRLDFFGAALNPEMARLARARLDTARDRVKSAQAAYNSALQEEAEYENLRQQYLLEQNSRVAPAK